jgi:tripartite-type tricarboxylate transporter receptor subunit TctC
LPNLPTVSDTVPGYEASSWFGLGAPKLTPPEVIEPLNTWVNAALVDPEMTARIADFGGTPLVGSPADFGNFMQRETEKWGNVVKFAKMKPE